MHSFLNSEEQQVAMHCKTFKNVQKSFLALTATSNLGQVEQTLMLIKTDEYLKSITKIL